MDFLERLLFALINKENLFTNHYITSILNFQTVFFYLRRI